MANSPQKILVLGGSQFIGRNLVETLIKETNFEITLFNRQKTNNRLFPGIQKIKGDRRTSDIKQIADEQWDYIIDCSCFFPDDLEAVIKSLSKPLKRYIFISTCSVYDNEVNKEIKRDEDAPTLACTADQRIDESDSTYGNRKAECERFLMRSGLPYLILRPALVFGRYDYTDRFYYWLYQVKYNQQLLIPEGGTRIFSTTYVDDLVRWIIQSINSINPNRVLNAVSYPSISIFKIINASEQVFNISRDHKAISPEILRSNHVAEWTGIPLWLNCDYFTYNNHRISTELSEPILFNQSLQKTIDYLDQTKWHIPTAGIKEERRQELIHLATHY